AMLRERSEKAMSRFSKERDADKALQERQKCLVKLASAGDNPRDVLMSLPSPEEIGRRADEAKAKAQVALANQKIILSAPPICFGILNQYYLLGFFRRLKANDKGYSGSVGQGDRWGSVAR